MKVAIVGGRARSEYFAIDQSRGSPWELWGLNAIRPGWVYRWARMFNLHRIAHLKRDWRENLWNERMWAEANPKVPFYVLDRWPRGWLPRQEIFPRKRLEAMPHGRYHAGSIDWMVAFAALLKADEISVHGIGLNLESGEPISARACLEYWCGYAEGRGIKVSIAKDCDLFAQYHYVKSNTVYGYDDVQLIERRP